MNRIKFEKGKQRKFFNKILENLSCPSLRLLKQYGIDINYQTLKSYYHEDRCLPSDLLETLCILAKIDKNGLKFQELRENWGQVKGGKNKFKRR